MKVLPTVNIISQEKAVRLNSGLSSEAVFIRDKNRVDGVSLKLNDNACVILENLGELESALLFTNRDYGYAFILTQAENFPAQIIMGRYPLN